MRDLTKLETATLLRRRKACSEARKWAKGKTLRHAWATCQRGDWLKWLADSLEVRMGPGARRAYREATAAERRAYREATAAAYRAYEEATAAAYRAYEEATAAERRAYREATAAARRACEEATAAERRALDEATAAAYRTAIPYDQIRDAARAFLAK